MSGGLSGGATPSPSSMPPAAMMARLVNTQGTWVALQTFALLSVVDSGFSIIGSSDATKTIKFEVDGQTAGDDLTINSGAQTDDRTATFPVLTGNSILALSNATLTSGRVPFATANGILTDAAALAWSGTSLNVTGDVNASGAIYGGQAILALGAGSYFDAVGSNPYFNLGGSGGTKPAGLTYGFYAKTGVGIAYVSSNNGAIDFEDQSANVYLQVRNTAVTLGVTGVAPASTTSAASLRLPHGSAPTSPVDGDMWTTTAGLFVRINGATVGPLS